MNLNYQEKEKINKKAITIYIVVSIICIIAIFVVIGVQVLGNDVIDNLFGINKLTKRTEQEETELKANFETIFNNEIEEKENYETKKMDKNRKIVYTGYVKEEKSNNYELNVNIPYVNIKNNEVQKFNNEIKDTFEKKAEEIIKTTDQSIIFTVKYATNIENDILSLIIYSDLKQNLSAQRIIMQTFNFNLENNKKLTLNETLDIYDINKSDVQNKINTNIQEEQRKSQDLIELGYNVFSRDIESEIYKLENIKEYFIYNNNIYIIFAYGNDKMTSEKDLVII